MAKCNVLPTSENKITSILQSAQCIQSNGESHGPKGQMGKGRFIDVLLSRIEAVQGRTQLLPSRLPFKLISEDVNRILNGLHVVLNALVQTHQKGPFVTVQRTTDFDALAVLVPPISWHRHAQSFPPFDTPKLEGCNGATFGLGRTEEKDGDVHELGRRD